MSTKLKLIVTVATIDLEDACEMAIKAAPARLWA